MSNQEITRTVLLLDENGAIAQPGFARKPFWTYNREMLPASRVRIKEWDYYLACAEDFGAAFTISDLGYVRMASVSFLNFKNNTETTKTALALPSLLWTMPSQPVQGVCEFKSGGLTLRFESAPNGKHVWCEYKNFEGKSDFKADLWFDPLPAESMNIATPWQDARYFYLNEKMNCMPVSGTIVYNWHVYRFNPRKNAGVLDWGRGYWPYKSQWYWGTASGYLQNHLFGLNLGYGFGDTHFASENCIFYDGKLHKLDEVVFDIPEDPMQPWKVRDNEGRLEAEFVPDFDRAAEISAGPVSSIQHQYFGKLYGYAVLDHGRRLEFKDFRAALEHVQNQY